MLILPPHSVGETVTLYAPAEYSCVVIAPDGSRAVYDAPTDRTDIPLTMTGVYRYEFSEGSTGEVVVVDAPEQKPTVIP